MSAEIDRPTPFAAYVLPTVFLGVLASLLAQTFGGSDLSCDVLIHGGAAAALAPLVILVSVVGLTLRARASHERAHRLHREALLVPCMLAPLAALAPWVVAPSHLGTALGQLPFFLAWLTRYPSLGPINVEVALGIGAVLGACAMPAFFALYASIARRPRPVVLFLFAVLQLVAYVPVLLRLDVELVMYALFVLREGPLSIVGPLGAPWWENALMALAIAAGPLLRALATAAMLAAVPLGLRRAPTVIWETE